MRFDITDKLKMDENPVLVIGDTEVTVKADATTVLQLMGIMDGEESNIYKMSKAQSLLFTKEDSQKILGLPFCDWVDLMTYAVQLATNGKIDNEVSEGELPVAPTMI